MNIHMMKEHIITVNALSKAGIFRKDTLWDASEIIFLKIGNGAEDYRENFW